MMVERYATGWTDPRAIFGTNQQFTLKKYGAEHYYKNKWGSPLMPKVKVDAHEYVTEAKDLPIETCVSMWVIKYGNETIQATETLGQGDLLWEIGNRLWWANRMNYDQANDTYEIIE
jgi:hypothetical protein